MRDRIHLGDRTGRTSTQGATGLGPGVLLRLGPWEFDQIEFLEVPRCEEGGPMSCEASSPKHQPVKHRAPSRAQTPPSWGLPVYTDHWQQVTVQDQRKTGGKQRANRHVVPVRPKMCWLRVDFGRSRPVDFGRESTDFDSRPQGRSVDVRPVGKSEEAGRSF